MNEIINWNECHLLEVTFDKPETFLKIKETLTRIGIPSSLNKTLYQSCHILHKQGRYFITHFKELFILDGKPSTFTETDLARRNTIATLLEDWELLKIVDSETIRKNTVPIRLIKIISYNDKKDWKLQPKYNIGTIRETDHEH